MKMSSKYVLMSCKHRQNLEIITEQTLVDIKDVHIINDRSKTLHDVKYISYSNIKFAASDVAYTLY